MCHRAHASSKAFYLMVHNLIARRNDAGILCNSAESSKTSVIVIPFHRVAQYQSSINDNNAAITKISLHNG